jgi:protein N-lysine methyltransferase METTL21A
MADEMMMRGEQLRLLKELLMAEEEVLEDEELCDETTDYEIMEDGRRILRYDSYLEHQRYYDDLKHVDCAFIDYGGGLVVEQDKALGKGGLCWDAAFILAEHVSSTEEELLQGKRVLELGAGTGLCGLLVASLVQCHVDITDLPALLPLMQRNQQLNFGGNRSSLLTDHTPAPLGTAAASILTWGSPAEYPSDPYDVILGADVVASLYDPIALAETMWDLSHAQSVVYISYKGRLTEPHEKFEERFRQLFDTVERLKPWSRNNNPHVWVLKATERRDTKVSG